MDKNTIIGFVLIAVVLIGFSWYNQPSAEQIEAQRKEDSIAAVMAVSIIEFLKEIDISYGDRKRNSLLLK